MTVHVAGNVTNSVFAASVEPFQQRTSTKFGDPNQLVLPGGHITAKVEGTIDNSDRHPEHAQHRPSTPSRSTP